MTFVNQVEERRVVNAQRSGQGSTNHIIDIIPLDSLSNCIQLFERSEQTDS